MSSELSEIQTKLLKLAKKIKAICEGHNIQYSLEGGSLLGAVRHEGFIPWDDDFDFIMKRENYERFIYYAKKELGEEYFVYTYNEYQTYPFAFAKVCMKDQYITYKNSFFSFPTLLHVDIFPFDYVPDRKIARKTQKMSSLFYKRMLIMHDGGKPDLTATLIEKILFKVAKPISMLFTHEYLVKRSEKTLKKYNSTENVALMVGVYGYDKTMIPSEWMDDYIDLKFEDTYFSCLRKYHSYLQQLYGDYLTIPPVEKRKGHDFYLNESYGA